MTRNSILALITLLVASCSLITETDISDSVVFIISPPNNMVTPTSTQTLWWEHVPDAEKYNVIIVSPQWDSIVTLVKDSNLTGNKFVVTLSPGEYDWGVSAYNNSSATPYTISHFTIDTSSNLGDQHVVLTLPKDNYITNQQKILFSWDFLPGADSYLFDIRYNTWEGANVFQTLITDSDTISALLDEGIYVWGVQAKNDLSTTFHSTQSLTIDTTRPGIPIITLPNKDTIGDGELLLKWTRPSPSLAEMKDSVLISTDSLFKTGNYSPIIVGEDVQLNLELFPKGSKYFARVRTFDAAGNISEEAAYRSFYIDEE